MSDTTINYGLKKPKYGTNPQLAKDLDQIDTAIAAALAAAGMGGGGGAGFTQAKLVFHDSDILNMQVDGSGGLVLLPGVTHKIYIPLFCVAHFHYGGVAAFGGTAFGDIILGGGSGGGSMAGSTSQLLESTSDFWERLLPINAGNTGELVSFAGQPLTFATQDTNLTGGDSGGNTNTLTITLGYLTYDTTTADVS